MTSDLIALIASAQITFLILLPLSFYCFLLRNMYSSTEKHQVECSVSRNW